MEEERRQAAYTMKMFVSGYRTFVTEAGAGALDSGLGPHPFSPHAQVRSTLTPIERPLSFQPDAFTQKSPSNTATRETDQCRQSQKKKAYNRSEVLLSAYAFASVSRMLKIVLSCQQVMSFISDISLIGIMCVVSFGVVSLFWAWPKTH